MTNPTRRSPLKGVDMRPIRRLLVVAATIAALAVLVPTASASSHGALHLTKTCDTYDHCTVVSSTAGPIPVGTESFYSGPVFTNRLSSNLVLVTPDGDTASGHCTLSYTTASGTCTFNRGTGGLAGFHANLTVTTADWLTFAWDGTYHIGD